MQNEADTTGKEITSQRIWELAEEHYIKPQGPFKLVSFESGRASRASDAERITATVRHNGNEVTITATGNGPGNASGNAFGYTLSRGSGVLTDGRRPTADGRQPSADSRRVR